MTTVETLEPSPNAAPAGDILLSVRDLVVEYPGRAGRKVHAVSGVSFDVRRGETIGLVGESGCGKTSTGRAIVSLPPPTSGSIRFEGTELVGASSKSIRQMRTRIQMILQDPISSLNPRRPVRDVIAEGRKVWARELGAMPASEVDELLEAVGLDPLVVGGRRAHEFSGGQCQRICVARALALRPALLICDEPVSALDVSVQAQVLNLLEDMRERFLLTMLFIAHDLAVVKNISDRIVVMYLGKICEIAPSVSLYEECAHPYTRLLIDSIPEASTDAVPLIEAIGDTPSPMDPPSGCRFRTRCPRADMTCTNVEPELREIGPEHFIACHHPLELADRRTATNRRTVTPVVSPGTGR